MKSAIEIFNANEIPKELLNDFEEQVELVFVSTEDVDETWSKPNWYIFTWVDNVWVSAATLYERTLYVGKTPYDVVGIGTVMTLPEYRNAGYSKELIDFATDFVCKRLRRSYMMLFCKPTMVEFFNSLNWECITSSVKFSTHVEKREMVKYKTMIWKCDTTNVWPDLEVDLCGLPW